MNLKPLYEAQNVLMQRIGYFKEDRFNKTITALIVEIAELANEVRFFKYWSKKQKPTGKHLEEYVDGLHFGLQFGLYMDFASEDDHIREIEECMGRREKPGTVAEAFEECFIYSTRLFEDDFYHTFMCYYLWLGELLGFTWEEIEKAYFDKNKVNHNRQAEGY